MPNFTPGVIPQSVVENQRKKLIPAAKNPMKDLQYILSKRGAAYGKISSVETDGTLRVQSLETNDTATVDTGLGAKAIEAYLPEGIVIFDSAFKVVQYQPPTIASDVSI